MIRSLFLALALAAGASSAAQAQQVFTVASCSATGVSNAPGTTGRFYAGPDGVLCVSGGGGGAANPYPGSDYATSARQDAQTAALGAPADAAYTGSGSAGNVALGKGQYAILSSILASAGAAGDTAATATGANGSQVALLKALRDKLNGTLSVSGTVTANVGTTGGLALDASVAAIGTATGAQADAQWSGSGNGSVVALLKYIASTVNSSNSAIYTTKDRIRQPVAGTNRSATVGTSAVTLMASNGSRAGWRIKNDTTGDIWINFDTTATAVAGGGNIKIAAGSSMTSEPNFVETGAMSAIGSAAGLAITAREY